MLMKNLVEATENQMVIWHHIINLLR
jgi:hypothetical protein